MRVFLFVIDGLGVWNQEQLSTFQVLKINEPSVDKSIPFLCNLGLRNAIQGRGNLLSPYSSYAGSLEGHREMMGVVSNEKYDVLGYGIPEEILDSLYEKFNIRWMANVQGRGKEIIPQYVKSKRFPSIIIYCGFDSTVSISFRVSDYKINDIIRYAETLMSELESVGIRLRKIIIRQYDYDLKSVQIRKELFYKVDFDERIQALGFSNVVINNKVQDILNINQAEILDCQSDFECMEALKSRPLKQDSFYFLNFPDFDVNAHKGDYNQCALTLINFDSFLHEFWKRMLINDYAIITSDHGVNIGKSDLSSAHVLECVAFMCFSKNMCYQFSGIKNGFGTVYETIQGIKNGSVFYDGYMHFLK